jgi:hypothetical protein
VSKMIGIDRPFLDAMVMIFDMMVFVVVLCWR